jgi:hypothetical protein
VAIQSFLSVQLDGFSTVAIPTEIAFTLSGSRVRLLLAQFDDGGPFTSSSWTSFVDGVVGYLVSQGYTDATPTALTTTVA